MIVLCGILLVVFLILTLTHPGNSFFMLTAFAAGGLINVLNGLKILRDKKKQSMAISYIFFGIIVVLLGIYFSLFA
jgi:apolipoprotein N-acyltransferase